MTKKATEYSIVNSYDSDILVFVDAKLLLESFHDKSLWSRFVAYMDTVASESHISSGAMRINEDDCERLHFMCVNSGVDTSDFKTWFNVQAVSGWYHSHGNILVDSGYIMCVPYDDIKDHIFGRYLGSVSVGTSVGDCGMSYKTSGMFNDKPSAYIEVRDITERFYKIDCFEIIHTKADWEKICANK